MAHKGKLKIITSEVNPDHPEGSTRFHPSYFVQHDVVKIEGVTGRATIKAYSEEGAHCSGYPAALLTRLTEWQEGPSLAEFALPAAMLERRRDALGL